MRTCDMRFPGFDARSNRGRIRWELFTHRDVAGVLLTLREDTLCVVFHGEPNPHGWARTLCDAGFPRPVFSGPRGKAFVDGPRGAAA